MSSPPASKDAFEARLPFPRRFGDWVGRDDPGASPVPNSGRHVQHTGEGFFLRPGETTGMLQSRDSALVGVAHDPARDRVRDLPGVPARDAAPGAALASLVPTRGFLPARDASPDESCKSRTGVNDLSEFLRLVARTPDDGYIPPESDAPPPPEPFPEPPPEFPPPDQPDEPVCTCTFECRPP